MNIHDMGRKINEEVGKINPGIAELASLCETEWNPNEMTLYVSGFGGYYTLDLNHDENNYKGVVLLTSYIVAQLIIDANDEAEEDEYDDEDYEEEYSEDDEDYEEDSEDEDEYDFSDYQ